MVKCLKLFLFGLICVNLSPIGCLPVESYNDSKTEIENVVPSEEEQLSLYTGTSLRKCHCDANHFWHRDECHYANTSVDILVYLPKYEIKKLATTKFDKVLIAKVSCLENETSIDIYRGALTQYYSIVHQYTNEHFENFCVENIQDENGDIVMVSSVCIPQNLELPLCCPPSEVLNDKTMSCQKGNPGPFSLPIKMGPRNLVEPNLVFYTQNIPKDIYNEKVLLSTKDNLTSLDYLKGKIKLTQWEVPFETLMFSLPPSQYCIVLQDQMKDEEYPAYIWWDDDWYSDYNEIPEATTESKCEATMHWILLPLLIISAIFLVAILVLHSILPNLRKSTGSKNTMCHMSSLLAGFCLLIILHIPQKHPCKIYGPLIQFSFLATFFWLNVMCFDIWWKLRCGNPTGERAHSGRRRFFLYSIYAWGSPLLVGAVTVAMDNIPALQQKGNLILPGFDQGGDCWFADRRATFVYYFGVIAGLMAVNVFFFLWVFVILVNANCIYNQVLNNDTADNKRVWIYLKIFCLMGVTWICEFFSWQEGTCSIWIVTDIINVLRGLILFIIFFGNRKSANKICERVASLNATFNSRLSRSMNNLRKLSLIPSMTLESAIDSRRTSEVVSPADLPNKMMNPLQEEQGRENDPKNEKRKRNPSSSISVNVESRMDSSSSSSQPKKAPSCPAAISSLKHPAQSQGAPKPQEEKLQDLQNGSVEFYI